jgi:hypothetical protein
VSCRALGFLMLVSLLFTTALAAGAKYFEPWLPEAGMQAAGFGLSFVCITLLFCAADAHEVEVVVASHLGIVAMKICKRCRALWRALRPLLNQ